jgi:xanthine/uracil/vitamin C permease (AzgA family)
MMPFTNNIAYGFIGGFGTWLICKGVTYQIHPIQQKWPGYALHKRWTIRRSMQVRDRLAVFHPTLVLLHLVKCTSFLSKFLAQKF